MERAVWKAVTTLLAVYIIWSGTQAIPVMIKNNKAESSIDGSAAKEQK